MKFVPKTDSYDMVHRQTLALEAQVAVSEKILAQLTYFNKKKFWAAEENQEEPYDDWDGNR